MVNLTFRDASLDAPTPMHFPDVVAAFEELGFRRIGRLERVYPDVECAAAAYAVEHRALFRQNTSFPMVVLAAADDSAFVLVDSWWNEPEVRIRTPMTDGSVVETRRAWGDAPVLPVPLQRIRHKLDLAQEQILSSAPAGGRPVAAVGGTPVDIWAAHRQQIEFWVQARGTQPIACRNVEEAVALSQRLAAHDFQVAHRLFQIRLGLLGVWFAAGVLLPLRWWLSSPLGRTETTVHLVLVLLWLAVLLRPPRLSRIRYVRSLRPPLVASQRRKRVTAIVLTGCLITSLTAISAFTAFDGSGSSYAFLYTHPGSGQPVTYDPCKPIEYVVHDRLAPEGASGLLRESIQEISTATGLTFVYLGRVEDAAYRRAATGQSGREPVLIGWATPVDVSRLSGRTVGLGGSTTAYNDRGQLEYVTGSVVLDAPAIARILQRDAGRARVRAIMLHELGHLVGLDHVDDSGEIMDSGNGRERDLGRGDRAGLAALGSGGCSG